MLRPVIVGFIEAQRSTRIVSERVMLLEIYRFMRHAWDPRLGVRGGTALYLNIDAYYRNEIDKIQRRVDAVKNIIVSARRDGDEAIAQAVLPELARKEAAIRGLEERRDKTKNDLEPDLVTNQLASRDGADRPMKRARSST